MKMKEITRNKGLLLAGILGLSFLGIAIYSLSSNSVNSSNGELIEKIFPNKKALPIYVIYSNTCPHCENLINTLKKEGINVYLINLYNAGKLNIPKEIASQFKGTPMVFAKVNNTYIIITGYPAKFQDKNGYFNGKDKEESYCKAVGGKPYYENNTYKFCWLSNNTILGNKYAIEWLVSQCEKGYCQEINLK